MKKLLFVFIVVTLTNSVFALEPAMDPVADAQTNMWIVRNSTNRGACLLGAAGVLGMASSLVEGNFTHLALNTMTTLIAWHMSKEPRCRIVIAKHDTILEDSYTEGFFDEDCLIAAKKAQLGEEIVVVRECAE